MNPLRAVLIADYIAELRAALRAGADALRTVRRLERHPAYRATAPVALQAHADLGAAMGEAAVVVWSWAGLLDLDDTDLSEAEHRAVLASVEWDTSCHEDAHGEAPRKALQAARRAVGRLLKETAP